MENWFFIHFSPIFQDFFILYTSVTYQKFWGWLAGVLFAGLGGGCINPWIYSFPSEANFQFQSFPSAFCRLCLRSGFLSCPLEIERVLVHGVDNSNSPRSTYLDFWPDSVELISNFLLVSCDFWQRQFLVHCIWSWCGMVSPAGWLAGWSFFLSTLHKEFNSFFSCSESGSSMDWKLAKASPLCLVSTLHALSYQCFPTLFSVFTFISLYNPDYF